MVCVIKYVMVQYYLIMQQNVSFEKNQTNVGQTFGVIGVCQKFTVRIL